MDITSNPKGKDGVTITLLRQTTSQEIVHESRKVYDSAIHMETLVRGQQAAEPKLAFSSNETRGGPSASELIMGQAQEEEVRAVNLASDTDPMDLSGHFLETQPMEIQVIDTAQHITPSA